MYCSHCPAASFTLEQPVCLFHDLGIGEGSASACRQALSLGWPAVPSGEIPVMQKKCVLFQVFSQQVPLN